MLVRNITESEQLDEIDPATYSLDSIKTTHLLTTEIDFTETSEISIKTPLLEGIVDIPENRQKLQDILTNHKPLLPQAHDHSSFVDVGRFPVGGGD
jgi:hypothetical protein